MANHDNGYKRLFSHASVVADLLRGFVKQVEEDVRASVHAWLTQVLMPLRFPDLPLAEVQNLEEVPTMLAERAREWTLEWKEEGRQEGLAEARKELHDLLFAQIAERFGPVPESVRLRIEAITDLKALSQLGKRLLTAASLADLGL